MKTFEKVTMLAVLIAAPIFSYAQVVQIVFTTSEQIIEPDEISDVITIQLQDDEGKSFQTTETIDLVFSSDSPTGEFLNPSTTTPVITTMASSTANKSFRYRDSTAGNFTLTVNATGRTSGNTWSVSQDINVEAHIPSLPVIEISGLITSNTTWTAGFVYSIDSSFSVATGTTLTIEPGAIVKAKTTAIGGPSIYGTLIAIGTVEEPIYFTSLQDDSVGGDSDGNGATVGENGQWQGLYFKTGSIGELDHVTLRYAGDGGYEWGDFVGIENDGGALEIKNSYIHDNHKFFIGLDMGSGVWQRSGSLIIKDSILSNQIFGLNMSGGTVNAASNTFTSNSLYGIHASDGDSLTLTDNNFSGNNKTAFISVRIDFSHSGNTSADTGSRGYEMSGTVESDRTWEMNDLPFIIPASAMLWVNSSSTLTINSGTMIKFGSAASMIIEGTLVAEGTEEYEIYFTSLKDDSAGGDTNNDGAATLPASQDWNGIEFWDGSTGELSHAVIRYTGGVGPSGSQRSAIYNLGGSVLLDNITFSNNFNNDVYQVTGSTTVLHSIFSSGTNQALYNTGTSTLDARLNWWGDATGPTHSTNATGTGPVISDNVLFDPWIKRDPALPNPVIIVPGIISSKLSNNEGEKWPNALLMAIPGPDIFLDSLTLNDDGEDQSSITPVSIIKSIPGVNFFEGLFSLLNSIEYIENENLFEYPYDWRFDVLKTASDTESETILSLYEKINQIKIQTGAEKVDLIAHSMGGLLVKKYLKDYGGGSVGKFIDVGTPHTGAPKAFKILNYGDNLDVSFLFGLLGLNSQRVKSITQNMPAVYQLLPSQKYFEDAMLNYYVFDGTNGSSRLTFSQTGDYLKAEGRNAALVDRANAFHQEIDNLDPTDPVYEVETYNIVGCGTPTIGNFYLLEGGAHPIYNLGWINGDGTVPLKSAEAMQANQTYYVKNANHAVMPSTSGVKELVASLLTGDAFNISLYSNLATNSNDCQFPNGQVVSLHSPIELHVYDSSGKHVGPDENGDIENEISGVVYEVIDGNKFAFLPEGIQYNIQGSATGAGTFDARIQEIVDGEVATTTLFTDIPLTFTTQMNFDIGLSIPTQIYLDHNGDGDFESSQAVSTTTAGLLESTGKVATVSVEPTTISSSSSGSSRAQVSSLEIVEETATSSGIAQFVPTVAEVLGASIIKTDPLEVQSTSTAVFQSEKEKENNNTAIVYKSFGQKLKGIFKSLWGWIKSKLQ